MKMQLLVLGSCLVLAGCGCGNTDTSCKNREKLQEQVYARKQQMTDDYYAGKPVLLAIAPDGTKIFKVRDPGNGPVYFSTKGTQWDTSCGKGCTKNVTNQNN